MASQRRRSGCIPLKLQFKDAEGRAIRPTLALPPNLYIIGTVNVDSTTHAFSPRCWTGHKPLRLRPPIWRALLYTHGDVSVTLADDEQTALLTALRGRRTVTKIEKARIIEGSAAKDSEFMIHLSAKYWSSGCVPSSCTSATALWTKSWLTSQARGAYR